jgi:hypothetical protein
MFAEIRNAAAITAADTTMVRSIATSRGLFAGG